MKKPFRSIYLLDFLFILRPTQFFPIWITFLAGYAVASEATPLSQFSIPISELIAATIVGGCVYLFNQLVDVKSDKLNGKLFILADGVFSEKIFLVQGIVLTTIGIWWAWQISIPFFFTAIISTILGYGYNYIGLMNRPIPSALGNLIGGCLTFLTGYYTYSPQFIGTELLYSLPFGFAWCAVALLVALPDAEGDRRVGKITPAVRFGVQTTTFAAMMFDLLALIAAIVFMNVQLFFTVGISALLSLPLFIQVYRKSNPKEIFTPVKFSMLFLALGVCVFIPTMLLFLCAIFFLSKFYYSTRFGLDYPNFNKKS